MTQPPPNYPPPPPPAGGGYPAPQGVPPDNYLVWTILATILCCWPIGAFAIYKSTQVNKFWGMGNFDEAQKASADARKLSIWAAVAGVVVGIIWIILVAVGGVFSVSTHTSTY